MEYFIDEKQLMVIKNVPADSVVTITHPMEIVEKKEIVRGMELTVLWRGCDVIDILPHGEHLRLYQRDLSAAKYYPKSEDIEYKGASNYGPTQQGGKRYV